MREIKRHFRHTPGITPTPYQSFHTGRVDPAVPAVAGSLAPDCSANSVRNDGSDLAIEELGRPAPHACDPGKLGALGNLAAGLRGMAGKVLPLFQIGVILFESHPSLLGERVGIMNQVLVSGELGVDLDCFALGEGLDAGVAVGAEQDADRHVQFLVELIGEGERQGGKTTCGIGFLPTLLGSGPFLRVKGGHRVYVDFPDGHLNLG